MQVINILSSYQVRRTLRSKPIELVSNSYQIPIISISNSYQVHIKRLSSPSQARIEVSQSSQTKCISNPYQAHITFLTKHSIANNYFTTIVRSLRGSYVCSLTTKCQLYWDGGRFFGLRLGFFVVRSWSHRTPIGNTSETHRRPTGSP